MIRRFSLPGILLGYAVLCVVGIDWGLPGRHVDPYLFGDAEPWSGERIAELAGAGEKTSATRGADVDADPLARGDGPVLLTDTPEKVAAIYLRYRLYTHQPDEMITMMALAQMRPGEGDLDPRLYQYGGLFIYPVGALIAACGQVGLIEVRPDLVYYLDHPEAFARFYIAARAYVAAWGVFGVLVVYLIARRLAGHGAGLLAAGLFALLPVVVCMSHEAKPHLPGAVLMLTAVWLAMRYVESGRRRDWLGTSAACGAAFGMVLSALPIFILIPLVELVRVYRGGVRLARAVGRATLGVLLGGGVYVATNPYVVINLFANREVLRSNFGNSLAMYAVDRLGEGLLRMLELTVEGAGPFVVVVGVVAMVWLVHRRRGEALLLAVPTLLLFIQFTMIGADKPAEYARFGVFIDAVLAIAVTWGLTRATRNQSARSVQAVALLALVWTAPFGAVYLIGFAADTPPKNTRLVAAKALAENTEPIAVLAEPAPYCCPPLNFAVRQVWLYGSIVHWRHAQQETGTRQVSEPAPSLVDPLDTPLPESANQYRPRAWRCLGRPHLFLGETPISWANKLIYAFPAP